jgi:hypothetical protein
LVASYLASSKVSYSDDFRSKIVENLAVLNYDTNNLHLAPYDWRLSYWNLEERDGYFSRLKTTIEGFKSVARRLSGQSCNSLQASTKKEERSGRSLDGSNGG